MSNSYKFISGLYRIKDQFRVAEKLYKINLWSSEEIMAQIRTAQVVFTQGVEMYTNADWIDRLKHTVDRVFNIL
jgi:hypothetical protein